MKLAEIVKFVLLAAILVLCYLTYNRTNQVKQQYQIILPQMDSIRQAAIDTLIKYEQDTTHISTVSNAIRILTEGQ